MNLASWLKFRVRATFRNVLSVSVFVKIMGIGLLVAMVFGAVTLTRIRSSISLARG